MGSSIRRTDLLALSNLRSDGRKPNEIRRVRVQLSPISTTTLEAVGGSALIEMGLTVAMATVRGPMSCIRRSDERSDRAILDVSIYTAPFAPAGGDRRIVNPNTDRRMLELSNQLIKALEATIHLSLYPKSRIQIGVVILADDGGRLPAAINAASLALIDAGIPMKDILCACSGGFSGGSGSGGGGGADVTLVDLNRQEESSYGGQNAICLPCAMLPQRGTIVLAQAEARVPDFDTLDRVLEAAMDGCRAIFEVMQAAIRERATLLLGMRSGQPGTKVVNSMDVDNDDD